MSHPTRKNPRLKYARNKDHLLIPTPVFLAWQMARKADQLIGPQLREKLANQRRCSYDSLSAVSRHRIPKPVYVYETQI